MDSHRARSFGTAATQYARYRPGYPDAALDWALAPIAGRPDPRLLDLAAGTGKLTASLLPRGTVIAVEPDPAMLAELRSRVPGVEAYEGSAEEIPLPDGCLDAVLVGQAWHWFDPERAHPEIARVLRPGGVLAALWNGDDASVEWVRGYNDAAGMRRTVVRAPQDEPRLPAHPAFEPAEIAQFANPVPTTVDLLVATQRTQSWALTAEPAEREAALDRIRTYLATRPETVSGEFELPLVTDVVRMLRR
ncbi:class I SAM-dependent methyltransferase [Pseudonocardia sp. MH-G8]|uniref:class I SAM-dependent methyltransferase n=1 Tax=Pseudonocardia sp. MH-G8 TaxID=1854588 RepID=UPI000BA12556|nr:class I SAM-dependent methyltransferase [Pseudonocardia sp. MH-G8]OZM82697.1 SAM-dependent methyltransferase [Pseudonocardia sp. MH-G8]